VTAEFRASDAGAPDDGAPEIPGAPSTCALCGTMVPAADIRCPECRMDARFGPGQPRAFSRATLWALVGVLVAVYLVTLGLVALVR